MSVDIHTRAAQLVRDHHGEMTMSEAYSALAKRRHHYGKKTITPQDRQAVANVEKPAGPRFWWEDL